MDKAGELPGLEYSIVDYIAEVLTGKIDVKERNKTNSNRTSTRTLTTTTTTTR